MPKVAIIGTRGYPSYYGGFETAVRKLAPYLADRGWDVTVYGRPGTAIGTTEADHRIRTIQTWGIESKSLSTLSYGATSTVHAAIQRPDVALVMNCANGFWLPMLRLRCVPSLVNVDGIEWEREKWGQAARRVFRAGAKMTARWASNLVFDARAIEARWNHEFNRRGEFIPYGGDRPEALSEAETPEFEVGSYLLLVARFVPENSVGEFFEAVDQLGETHTVVIVGSSGYGGDLDDRAAALEGRYANVHWLGHVKDDRRLARLWANAGAYFHGHSVGGTNPALVQAMACGAPVIARDTVYNREVLGDAAVFVDADSAEIAAAARRLIADRETRLLLSAAAQARAEESYTWDGVCAGYHDALTALLPRSVESESEVQR